MDETNSTTTRGIGAQQADDVYKYADRARVLLGPIRDAISSDEDLERILGPNAKEINKKLELIMRRTDPEARR